MSTQVEEPANASIAVRRPYDRALPVLARLRAGLRLAAIGAGSALLALSWFLFLPFCALSSALRRAWRGIVFRAWSRWCLACLGVELCVRGTPARPPAIMVTNHLSYIDILVLASQQNCVFVSAAEVRQYPFIGWMASSFGTVFVEREQKRELPRAGREMQEFLARGYMVVLFPEGTNSRGSAVQSFRPALLEPAVQDGRAVAYATLSYSTTAPDPPASQSVSWVETPMVRHALRMLALAGIRAQLIYGDELVLPSDRKSLARELHDRVARAFTPME